MYVVLIEHPVPDFNEWKSAFDSDPVGRERSGVRRYKVMRPVDNERYAMIELEFDSLSHAEAMAASLRELWRGAGGQVMTNPKLRIIEVVETKEVGAGSGRQTA